MTSITDFSLPSTGDKTFSFSDAVKDKSLVIYFYPRDNTPGCTNETQDFKQLYPEFQKLNCDVVGISRDSIKSHEKFKAKLELPFELLSDEDETVCELFEVIKLKNMYGKQVRGIERSTFVFVKQGQLSQQWRKVKVKDHAQAVLDYLVSLNPS